MRPPRQRDRRLDQVLGVAVAMLTLVSTIVAAVPAPADAAAPHPVTLVAPSRAVAGAPVVVRGRITRAQATGRTVLIERRTKGHWRVIRRTRTGHRGVFRTSVTFPRPGSVDLRARTPRHRSQRAASSAVRHVSVDPASAISLKLVGAPPVAQGDELVLAGVTAPAGARDGVELQERGARGWSRSPVLPRVSSTGTFTWTLRARTGPPRSFRALLRRSPGRYGPSTSPVVKLPAVAAARVSWASGSPGTVTVVKGSLGSWSRDFSAAGVSADGLSVSLTGALADRSVASAYVSGGDGSASVTLDTTSLPVGSQSGTVRLLSYGKPVGGAWSLDVDVTEPTAMTLPSSPFVPATPEIPAPGRGGLVTAVLVRGADSLSDVAGSVATDYGLTLGGSDDDLDVVDFLAGTDDVRDLVDAMRDDPRIREVTSAPRATAQGRPRDEAWTLSSDSWRWQLEAVNAPKAWDTTSGSHAIIGIVDQGFNAKHEDLAPNVVREYGTSSAADHGNNVAGAACAAENNTRVNFLGQVSYVGTTGSAPDCILALEDITWGPSATPTVFTTKIDELASTGVQIINVSGAWSAIAGAGACTGTMSSAAASAYRDLKSIAAMIRDVARRHPSKLFVFAAGNDGQDVGCSNYMGVNAEPNVLVVANTTRAGVLAADSNRGSGVSVAAPGSNVYLPNRADRSYGFTSGTSFSAPLVAGVAGLAKSANSRVTAAQIKACIITSAQGRTVPTQGFGIIDAAKTVRCAQTAPDLSARRWTVGALTVPLTEVWGAVGSADPASGWAADLTNGVPCTNCTGPGPHPPVYAALGLVARSVGCTPVATCVPTSRRVGPAPTLTVGGLSPDMSGRATMDGGYTGTQLYWCFSAKGVCVQYLQAADTDVEISANLTSTLARATWR